MSRQSSALSFETSDSSLSYGTNDCFFTSDLRAQSADDHNLNVATLMPPLLTFGGDESIDSWMTNLPSGPPDTSFHDFELFNRENDLSQDLPLFNIQEPIPQAIDPSITELPAVKIAGGSLYVDKATSTSNELHETSSPQKISTASKKIAPRPSRQITTSKKVAKRHACEMPSCRNSFVRRSDVLRHLADVHGTATHFYSCEAHPCPYHTNRRDKMKEHCQKMHGHRKGSESFAVVQR